MADASLNSKRRFSRPLVTMFWSALVAAIVITLLYYERVDVLYILATLGLVALLVIVATSDLEGKTKIVGDDNVKI